MSISVLAAFACAIFAAVGTGVLVGRCVRTPRMDIIAWACAMGGLAISLVAQALGSESGYGSATFRTVQIAAQLIAPLWLAWGLVELTGKGVAVRFGAKLITSALTFFGVVVLVTDPLTSTAFGKTWPVVSEHYQIIPKSVLSLVAAVTVITVVIALAAAGARARNDPAWRYPVLAAAAAAAAAVAVLALRLSLPANSAYPLLCAVAVALTWFAGVRADRIDLDALHEGASPRAVAEREDDSQDRYGQQPEPFGDGYPRHEPDRGDPFGDENWYQPAAGQQANNGYRGSGEYLPNGTHRPETGYRPDGGNEMNGVDDGDRGPDLDERVQADRGAIWRPKGLGRDTAMTDAAVTGPAPAVPDAAQQMYGLIAIYTLADGQDADFDALAERVVDEVRASEPDALVYAVHTVPNAPMQRIFYEVYRDRMAYEEHRRQHYIQRFEVERSPYVIATNVIELGMQQAKLSEMPGLSKLFGGSAGL